MSRAFIFVAKGITGGTATLVYRLGVALQRKDFDVYYIKELCNNNSNETLIQNAGIHVITTEQKKWKITVVEIGQRYDEVYLMTFVFQYFCMIENAKYKLLKKKVCANAYLYTTLPDCLIIGNRSRSSHPAAFRLLNFLSRPYINELLNNRQVLFMDQLSIETHKAFFGRDISNELLFRLPYAIPAGYSEPHEFKPVIMTMARMDFPFKGYIIGLIDSFAELKHKYQNLQLWIIGNGTSEDALQGKVKTLDALSQKDVLLYGNMDYNKLHDVLREAGVFVGMGTCILDAAAVFTPAIAVQSSTYQCLCKGLFSEYPEDIGYTSDQGLHEATTDIERVLTMNQDTYIALCNRNRTIIEQLYSIDTYISRLMCLPNNTKWIRRTSRILNGLGNGLLSIYHCVRKVDWDSFDNN